MNYNIKIIPYEAQRYETVGDYWMKHSEQCEVRVSDFSEVVASEEDKKSFHINTETVAKAESFELLVAIHELVELFLCKRDGVSFKDIDEFDRAHPDSDEPGDEESAPYHKQHVQASLIERYLAQVLGVDWEEYDRAIRAFDEKHEQEKQST